MLEGSLPGLCGEEAEGGPGRKQGGPCCCIAGGRLQRLGPGAHGAEGEEWRVLALVFRASLQDSLVDSIRGMRAQRHQERPPVPWPKQGRGGVGGAAG